MNGINLMPAHRRQAHRRMARVRIWSTAAAIVGFVAILAQGMLWSAWRYRGPDLLHESEKLSKEITEDERLVAQSRTEVKKLRDQWEAEHEVADQPDWGLLLSCVADKLGPEAALEECRLAKEAGGNKAEPVKPGTPAKAAPSRQVLVLTGVARSQDSASKVALGLKELGVFEGVSLVEARRTAFMSAEATWFRIDCQIGDVGPSTVAGAGGEP